MRARWLTIAALVAPGLLLVLQLQFFWTLDEQYAYGWAVPALAALLLWSRWRDRPFPAAGSWCGGVVAFAAAGLLLPLRFLLEAAPDWSVLNWLWALVVVALMIALLHALGGRAWARWFALPVIFLLTAVPWPQRFELAVTGGLLRFVASSTAEVLGWFGIAAWTSGHVLQLSAGPLGVDEACSGIRSLQALLMVAVFLGEFYRLRWPRRIALFGAGLILAIAANLFRTVTLAIVVAHRGLDALERWHDGTGYGALLLALGATWWLASRLRPRHPAAPLTGPGAPLPALPAPWCAALLLWLITVEIGTESWYRAHETRNRGWAWSIRWPESEPRFRTLEVPPRARRLLLCDHAQGAAWEEDGHRWLLYWLRWEPGRVAAQTARMHGPDTCLQAGGAVLQQDLGVRTLHVGALALPFRTFVFVDGGLPLHVFFCLDEQSHADGGATDPEGRWTRERCWQRAFAGRRNTGQQSLEIAILGCESAVVAEHAVERRLSDWVMVPGR
jgi:exosortase